MTGIITRTTGPLGRNWLTAWTRVTPGPWAVSRKPVCQSATIREKPELSVAWLYPPQSARPPEPHGHKPGAQGTDGG